MSTPEIIFAALAACAPIVSVFIAWLAFRQKKDLNLKDEAKELGSMQSDIAYIKAGIDDLKEDNKNKDERLDKMSESLVRVEERLNSHIQNKTIHNYKKSIKGESK